MKAEIKREEPLETFASLLDFEDVSTPSFLNSNQQVLPLGGGREGYIVLSPISFEIA
jgi:hypothetical protein